MMPGLCPALSNMFSELKYYKEEVKRLSPQITLASIVGTVMHFRSQGAGAMERDPHTVSIL
jgi:hypothetical protein